MATLTLQCAPRNNRNFDARVALAGATLSGKQLVIGCKSTAGAPTTQTSMDVGVSANQILGDVTQAIVRLTAGLYGGQVVKQGCLFAHAPGADVKVYAALQDNGAAAGDPFDVVSPGVLLRA